ncbi:MAG: hypothetical protein SOT07_09340 [Paludibacteraceae bacterium]|nr:hypothetical protein [Paludibacteraceae bacterium]
MLIEKLGAFIAQASEEIYKVLTEDKKEDIRPEMTVGIIDDPDDFIDASDFIDDEMKKKVDDSDIESLKT